MCEVFLKSAGMLEEMEEMRKGKTILEVRLLRRLEELKKAFDDISRLQERVASDQSEIASLRAQINQECAEKMERKHKIQRLKNDLERREHDIEELKANVVCYNELLRATMICSWRRERCALRFRSGPLAVEQKA